MFMKRQASLFLSVLLLLGCLSGCGGSPAPASASAPAASGSAASTAASGSEPLQVVATIFPEYDWVRQIVGESENVELTLLLDKGTDLHSYQPSADDMVKIATSDLFIYVGGESDDWVDDALESAGNPDRQVINLLETLGDAVKEEEIVEGMQAEAEEEEESAYDEHVWLSLKNAEICCAAIADALASLDAENADTYAANAKAYIAQLTALDEAYAAAVSAAPVKTLLFGDRFPFRYLTDDYGLDYYAAFVGCSAETEASFETVVFLAGKVDELGLKHVMQIESGDGRIAQTIIQSTQAKSADVLTLDSLQSTTAQDVAAGKTYLGLMEENLNVLKQALT